MTMTASVSQLMFYVIYTPGTVRGLLPFVDTLLRWSDCTFCLVANGCGAEETALLRERCAGAPRLSWRSLPWPRKVVHGQVLNHLFAASDQPYFCFMDSDILATDDFMAELRPALPGAAGLFSAWPITITAAERILPEDGRSISGRHSHTATGLCLGGSYCAIYEHTALARALRLAPDGFNCGYWAQLPRETQRFLAASGQERLFYDTGRVLNLYLQGHGGVLRVQECAALLHLGSYSIYTGRAPQPAPRFWRRALRAASRRLRERLNGQSYRDAVLRQVAQEPIQRRVDQRRALLAGYFGNLTRALAAGTALPAPPQGLETEIEEKLAHATQTLTLVLGKS